MRAGGGCRLPLQGPRDRGESLHPRNKPPTDACDTLAGTEAAGGPAKASGLGLRVILQQIAASLAKLGPLAGAGRGRAEHRGGGRGRAALRVFGTGDCIC